MISRLGLLAVLILANSVSAQDPPKTDFGFDPKTAAAPDPTRGRVVARVFDEYVYVSELGGKNPLTHPPALRRLQERVWRPLVVRFVEQEKLTAEPQEIGRLILDQHPLEMPRPIGAGDVVNFLRVLFGGTDIERWYVQLHIAAVPAAEAAIAWQAASIILQWKLDHALYQRYGGSIVERPSFMSKAMGSASITAMFCRHEPRSAYESLLSDAISRGAIEFFDLQERDAFPPLFFLDIDDPPPPVAAAESDLRLERWDLVSQPKRLTVEAAIYAALMENTYRGLLMSD